MTAPKADSRSELGQQGEMLARRYLEKNGMTILAANFRTRRGEIDLVADDHGTVVFVEVKTRSQTLYGAPYEAVTARKQRQMSMVALEFLDRNRLTDRPARFDVLSVLIPHNRPPRLELMKNAFDLAPGCA
jgi:putative endonuclease